jgi:hypothetical protein
MPGSNEIVCFLIHDCKKGVRPFKYTTISTCVSTPHQMDWPLVARGNSPFLVLALGGH